MDISHNSLIAKLLAKENINVFSGNFETAYFEPKGRNLGLPNWKGLKKETSDLFISHEVGHALWTPLDIIERFQKEFKPIPFSVFNIVEDIRIEKKIKALYPGLISTFREGYTNLLAEDFFQLKKNPMIKMSFLDRINIKAKVGVLLDVPFTREELFLFNEALQVQTHEDVFDMCRKLYEYTLKDLQEPPPPSEGEDTEELSSADENTKISSSSEKEESEGQEQKQQSTPSKEDVEKAIEELSSKTDRSLDEAMKSKIEYIQDTLFFISPSKDMLYKNILSYQKFYKKYSTNNTLDIFTKKTIGDRINSLYPEFMRGIRLNVAILALEFNRRKAAFEYSRATESKSGKINLNKLHSYKYNEDIFLSVTQLAQAKSHGLILLIDYSASMIPQISSVVSQTIAIVEFCKLVGIPFDVYTFTADPSKYEKDLMIKELYHLDLIKTNMSQVLSSSMKKSEYDKAIKYLHCLYEVYREFKENFKDFNFEPMGNTPLNESLIILNHLVTDFKNKHKIQKMNVLVITDGAGQLTNTITPNSSNIPKEAMPDKGRSTLKQRTLKGVINKKSIIIGCGTDYGCTKQHADLVNHIREDDVKLIGFYIPNKPSDITDTMNKCIHHSTEKLYLTNLKVDYKKQGFAKIEDALGYDSFFITSVGSILKDKEDVFKCNENFSDSELTASFKKFTNSRKSNRIFLTEFINAIA